MGLVSRQLPKHQYKKQPLEHIEIPNHLDRQFTVTAPNQVWAGNRWAYLAIVLDLFSRKPIGWAMSFSPDSQLTAKALKMAYESRGKLTGVMLHSDSNNVLARFHHTLTKKVGSCLKDGTNNVLSFLIHTAIDLMCPSLDLSIA
ncbi:hypothetical protein VcTj87_24640 [Vibrio comitans]